MSPEPTSTPNPNGGPRTPEGRAISSRNATTFGLYAATDFVRPHQESVYQMLAEQLRIELAPVGLLECGLVDEIRRAMWRLGRCGDVESSFVTDHADPTSIPDPMRHETQAKLQQSVDRARALYQRLFHKCTAELRKLQTERHLRNESFEAGTDLSSFGICDWASISKHRNRQIAADYQTDHLQTRARVDAIFAPPINLRDQPGSFCQTPRNAQCPCGSGQKHKRCCGKSAPPVLRAA